MIGSFLIDFIRTLVLINKEGFLVGFGFRKSLKLGGGFRLNLSKKGVGVSAGTKGLRVSVGPRGTRLRASVPGTGLYYETKLNKKRKVQPKPQKLQQKVQFEYEQPTSLSCGQRDQININKLREQIENYKPTWRDRLFNRVEVRKKLLQERLNAAIESEEGDSL
jgi:hypothetical protein